MLSAAPLRAPLAQLARENVYVGTSSWKYPGWLGQIYSPERYQFRGKFAESRFERDCLAEYSETFPTVCVDAAYYKFPSDKYLAGLCSQVPQGFKFGVKVTDAITIKHYPNLPRHGAMAGKDNPAFLNSVIFQTEFLRPWERYRSKLGVLMFEFSQFYPTDFAHGRDFVAALDTFFSQLPKGWPYAVEIRNRNFLHPEYFAMLRSHNVAHVFNSWTRMPSVAEQLEMPDCITSDIIVARLLLKPGRTYEDAVTKFSPYSQIQEVEEVVRMAGKMIIVKARTSGGKTVFIYVNNRLEGNAPLSIEAILKLAGIEVATLAVSPAPLTQPDSSADAGGQQALL